MCHSRAAPHRDKSQALGRRTSASSEAQNLVFLSGFYREAELRLRGGACTRFHPNRRASTDHKPGPNIARAPPMVPSKRGTQWSPDVVVICQVSTSAIDAPMMGVQSPGIRRSPDTARNAAVTVVLIGGSFHSTTLARAIKAEPPTRRISSKPVPGQPPANVEYRRRNIRPSIRY